MQTWGTKDQDGHCLGYMHPTPEEVGAETMLSLAHGVEGFFYEMYYSHYSYWNPPLYNLTEGLVELPEGDPPIFPPNILWNKVQQLTTRLKGKLGNILMTLDYTGDYLMLRQGVHQSSDVGNFQGDYFALTPTTTEPLNFHSGMFIDSSHLDNDYFYFLLTNQLTTNAREVNVEVTDRGTEYVNTRFRNIETEYNFDTTFTDEFSVDMEFPDGEGYLFQVAPVIKYGGRLIFNETVPDETTLNDVMIIENAAMLTIAGNYTANADIIVKNGSIVTTGNGKITFQGGH